MPELVFFRRGEEVLRFALDRPRVVLGRGEKSDVVIPDPSVSREQSALCFDGQRVTLEDLSGKGTVVSGIATRQAVLSDGSDLALGQWRAVYRDRSGEVKQENTRVTGTQTIRQPIDPSLQCARPAQLRVRHGQTETVHPFSSESITVGLDPANDLVLGDKFVSSRHLRVTRRGGLFHIVDRHSTNGTYLGDVRAFEIEAPLFTSLRIGDALLTIEPVQPARKEGAFHGIIGEHPSMRQVAELIDRVAPSSASV